MPPSEKVEITASMRRQIKSEIRRTGISALNLFKERPDLPDGLTPRLVNRWVSGLIKQGRSDHLNYVLSRYTALPDKSSTRSAEWFKYLPEMADQFCREMHRTGKTPMSLLHGLGDAPEGLNVQILESLYRRKTHFVRIDHWDFVLAHLVSLPGRAAPPDKRRYVSSHSRYPSISDDALAQLRHYRKRTGIGGDILLRLSSEKPEGLTARMISGWLTGATKSADPDYIEFVLNAYRKLLSK